MRERAGNYRNSSRYSTAIGYLHKWIGGWKRKAKSLVSSPVSTKWVTNLPRNIEVPWWKTPIKCFKSAPNSRTFYPPIACSHTPNSSSWTRSPVIRRRSAWNPRRPTKS
jgi:hypothetical protein